MGHDAASTELIPAEKAEESGGVVCVLEGPDQGHEIELTHGAVLVGTGSDCGLILTDTTVSRQHLRIEAATTGFVVADLGSKNGTLYLGTRLQQAVVPIGAVLTLGRTRLAFRSSRVVAGAVYSSLSNYGSICGSSPAMRRLYALLERVEQFPEYTVLIQGESGSGKDLVAREIHRHSHRAQKRFEVCDCASLPVNLAESELFGHKRGAFTNAYESHVGPFERALGGTIFLDEIGELPLVLQPKLLRVLQNEEVKPVGATDSVKVDVRVIAATNRDLAANVRQGLFREDLYFRLAMLNLSVPPLRSRREDIPLLVQRFLDEMGQGSLSLSPSTLELFTTGYDWPGNVRELRNAVVSALAFGEVPSSIKDKQETPPNPLSQADVDTGAPFRDAKRKVVDAFERDYLLAQIKKHHWNISQAARAAGIDRNYFRGLLQKHGLKSDAAE